MKPKFSILIPTRERHDTLHYSIRSVLEQSYSNFELIISDNLSSPETRVCVEKFKDQRIKYLRTSERLAMSDNWEFGLKHCSGDHVFILGDDDALIPNALSEAASILDLTPDKILSWNRASYFWPSAILKPSRNQLEISFGNGRMMLNSREMLANVYSFALPYFYLPMIYSSFVPRAVIERVRAMNSGNYFYGRAPDICSGIVNAIAADDYIHSQIPLSVAGVSGHSTGLAQGYQSLGSDAHKKLLAEGKENAERPKLHPQLVDSAHQYFLIADDLLKLRDKFNISGNGIQFNPMNLVNWVAGSLWADYDKYDEFTQDLIKFCNRHSIDTSKLQVPQKTKMTERYPSLFARNQKDPLREFYHTIDCSKFGVTDVWAAAQLLANLLPNYATGIAPGWRDTPTVTPTVAPTVAAPPPVAPAAPTVSAFPDFPLLSSPAGAQTSPHPSSLSREELIVEFVNSTTEYTRALFDDARFMRHFLPLTRLIDEDLTRRFEEAGFVGKLSALLDTDNCVAALMGLMLLYPPWNLQVSNLNDIPEWFRSTYVDFTTIASPVSNETAILG